MSDNIGYPNNPGNGKIYAGLILLGIGVIFLLHQLDFFFFPYWLFKWPMWLIIIGLFTGAKHNFRNFTWLILVFIGFANLVDMALPNYNLGHFMWPLALIAFGIWLILRRNHHWEQDNWSKKWDSNRNKHTYKFGSNYEPVITPVTPVGEPAAEAGSTAAGKGYGQGAGARMGDDYLDSVSIFGGVKKAILSKDFKGGEIVNIFGGAELDFTMADIQGRVIIDITQIFGGTKIIVPSNWQVVSDIAAVFSSVDDKRIRAAAAANGDKILVLKGVSIFAGIEVRSY